MPRTIADYARERDNDKRALRGKAADAAAASKINVGDLAAAARANAAKRATGGLKRKSVLKTFTLE